jgi:hypothetical protein
VSGGGEAVIGRVLRVCYEGVVGYHPVLVRQVVPAASRRLLDWVRAAMVKFLNEIIGLEVRTSAEPSHIRLFSLLRFILTEPSSGT